MADFNIPREVQEIIEKLRAASFEAYLVGGCVRDLLLRGLDPGRADAPKDWDIATNAKPEEIQKLFATFAGATADKPATVYENKFGTVGVKTGSADPRLAVVEVTTFRLEGRYTDKRHPDEIKFAATIEEDLSRRDFTVNALALDIAGEKKKAPASRARSTKSKTASGKTSPGKQADGPRIIDPFGGRADLKAKIIRAVGSPDERFNEDALRLMRAVRLAAELGFVVEEETRRAVEKHAGLLEMVAKERARDEFVKILETPRAAEGIRFLEKVGLLRYILPELREGTGVGQNKHHIYDIFEHNLRALDYAVRQGYSLDVRLASLLHDIGKPRSKRGNGPGATFHAHEYIGAKMVLRALDRLRFPKDFAERVAHLVRCHMFYYNVDEVTAAGVRRFLSRVGPENVDDIMKVREADRIGSGVPKAVVYKMRHLLFMIEKVRRDPVSPKMLAVRGNDVMRIAGIQPGPKVGQILAALLEEVIDEPGANDRERLEKRIRELAALPEKELQALAKKAKEKQSEFESGVEEEIKKKYYVK